MSLQSCSKWAANSKSVESVGQCDLPPKYFWSMSGCGCVSCLLPFRFFLCMQVLFVLLTAMKKVSSRNPGFSLPFATFAIICMRGLWPFVWKSSLGELSPKVSGEGLICAYVTLLQPGARFSVWLFLDRRNMLLFCSSFYYFDTGLFCQYLSQKWAIPNTEFAQNSAIILSKLIWFC